MKLKWSIDQLYFYLVCFVMLIVIIIGTTSLVRAGIELLIPIPEVERPYPIAEKLPEVEDESQLPRDVIEREIRDQEAFMLEAESRNTWNSTMQQIFRGLSQLLVAFPVYLYHWRKIPKLNGD